MSTQETNPSSVCPLCEGDRGEHQLFCASCKALFPAQNSFTYFDFFGLPQDYTIDTADLESRLLSITRCFHPDFFATNSLEQQELSLEHSAALNVAHATLKDDFKRAEYLLGLHGGASTSEDKSTPKGFLEEMLFLREELEEAVDGEDEDTVATLNTQLSARHQQLSEKLSELFRNLDESGAQETLEEIRLTLNAAKYINGLVRDSSSNRMPV